MCVCVCVCACVRQCGVPDKHTCSQCTVETLTLLSKKKKGLFALFVVMLVLGYYRIVFLGSIAHALCEARKAIGWVSVCVYAYVCVCVCVYVCVCVCGWRVSGPFHFLPFFLLLFGPLLFALLHDV